MQSKFRTIFSENPQVNNKLLSISGNIEDLLVLIGYSTRDLGNPDLKPNFFFSSSDACDFKKVREIYLKVIDDALAALNKSRLIEEQEKRKLDNSSKRKDEDYNKSEPEKRKPEETKDYKSVLE
jgi:hypothetical protein